MKSLHFSPPFDCDGAMPCPVMFSLGQIARQSRHYACAFFGRDNMTEHNLSPSRYETR